MYKFPRQVRQLLFLLGSLLVVVPGLAADTTQEFRLATEGYRFAFPRDHGAHEDFRTEWWYYTGQLMTKDGRPFGYELTFFRRSMPRDQTKTLPSQWAVTADRTEHDRRSVYLLARRNLRLPFLGAFDQPDAATSCSRRESSTHALQALELLNGTLANDLAGSFADRLRREAGTDPAAQVELAYRLAAGRPPTPREKELAVAFLRTQPLQEFALAVFNLNAFLYVD